MYVGGNFTGVKQGENGSKNSCLRGLAAFDVNTGDWTGPGLRLQQSGQGPLPLPDIASAGDFTRVNGETTRHRRHQPPPARSTPRGLVDHQRAERRPGRARYSTTTTATSTCGAPRAPEWRRPKVYGRNAARSVLDGRPDRGHPASSAAPFRPWASSEANGALSTPADTSPVHTARAHGTWRSLTKPKSAQTPNSLEPSTERRQVPQQPSPPAVTASSSAAPAPPVGYDTGTNPPSLRHRHHEHGRRHVASTISLQERHLRLLPLFPTAYHRQA